MFSYILTPKAQKEHFKTSKVHQAHKQHHTIRLSNSERKQAYINLHSQNNKEYMITKRPVIIRVIMRALYWREIFSFKMTSSESKLRLTPYSKAVFERAQQFAPARLGLFTFYRISFWFLVLAVPVALHYQVSRHGIHSAPFVYHKTPVPTTRVQDQFNKYF